MPLPSLAGPSVSAFVAPGSALPGAAEAAAADLPPDSRPTVDPYEACAVHIFSAHDHPMSVASLRAQVRRLDREWDLDDFTEALACKGFSAIRRPGNYDSLSSEGLPILVLLGAEKRPAVLIERSRQGYSVFDPARSAHVEERTGESLLLEYQGEFLRITPPLREPTDTSPLPRGRFGHWFLGPMLVARPLYFQIFLAAFVTNVFAMVAGLFTMVVYDTILPNNAVHSLYALLAGVIIVFVSDFAIRTLRGYFLDVAGARADMAIADSLFEQVLDMEVRARRGSTGELANVMKEFESVRDFLASATLTTFIDIPFALLFTIVIWIIGGPLSYIPLVILLAMLVVGLALQPMLRRLVQVGYEDGQQKHAVLVETLSGLETVKALGAGAMLRKRWQSAIAHQARVGLKTRFVAQLAGNFANLCAQASQIAIVAVGALLVAKGQITMGAIFACTMLAGKAIMPLAQLAQLLTRANQCWSSYKALQRLMAEPREHDPQKSYFPRDTFRGEFEFRNVSFRYPGQRSGGLDKVSFKIQAGERVAIIGRAGSGKTTLSKLLLGLYHPTDGAVMLDGSDLRQIDPADLRANVAAVTQEVWLMTGTVMQNIGIGTHRPTEEQVLQAAQASGVHDFISQHPDGYQMKLGERGEGLSGGQRQAITIARALIAESPVLLLDEPTSAMDINAERQLIERLRPAISGRTLIVITHKATLLELVDRVIVIDQGKVVADGPKSQVLGGGPPAGAPAAGARAPGPSAPAPMGAARAAAGA